MQRMAIARQNVHMLHHLYHGPGARTGSMYPSPDQRIMPTGSIQVTQVSGRSGPDQRAWGCCSPLTPTLRHA